MHFRRGYRNTNVVRFRFRLGARAKALTALGLALALVAGISIVTLVIAEPHYVAVCGDEDCATTTVSAEGGAASKPTVAIVPVAADGAMTLVNSNAVGYTLVKVLGYFDTDNPASTPTRYSPAPDSARVQYDLETGEKKTVALPAVPTGAKTMLVQLGGVIPISAQAQEATYQACTSSDTASNCTRAAIEVASDGGVPVDDLRDALQARAESTQAPATPTPSVEPGENLNVDNIVDAVMDANAAKDLTPEDTANPTAGSRAVPPYVPPVAPPVVVAAPAPTPTPSTGSSGGSSSTPAAGLAGWNLAWSDEFDDSSLDTGKWAVLNNSTYGAGNGELACLMADNVSEGNGVLTITAKRLASAMTCEGGASRSFTSGFVETKNKVSFTYGRYEARVKVPTCPGTSKGLWPAFWLRPASGGIGELDIMEIVGTSASNANEANKASQTIWYDYKGTHDKEVNVFKTPAGNYCGDFHTFAVEWEPGEIRWYIDGQLTYTRNQGTTGWLNEAFSRDFYIKLNMAVGGSWPGTPDAATAFPAAYQIDYVRVYQR